MVIYSRHLCLPMHLSLETLDCQHNHAKPNKKGVLKRFDS